MICTKAPVINFGKGGYTTEWGSEVLPLRKVGGGGLSHAEGGGGGGSQKVLG